MSAPSKDFLPSLIGSMSVGAAGNPTVEMIEAAFAHHGLHYRYVNMEVTPENLGKAIAGAAAMGFVGFNCSLPHKVSVIDHLDGLGESARIMGAVNCVVRRDGQWIGENTDGKGFLASLQAITSPEGKHVVVLGAGGAARAIAVELALARASRITIVNRDRSRGEALSHLLQESSLVTSCYQPWEIPFTMPRDADILVNATSVGLYDADARIQVHLDSLTADQVVADVIFNPPQTWLLREAARRGCRTLDGLGMIVQQGVVCLDYWTGCQADAGVMREAVEQALGLNSTP